MKTLDEIFASHNTDKGASYHNYTRQYEELLSKYRSNSLKYLEIGVLNGGSIAAMREVFENATCIVGLDITPGCKKFENKDKNIFIEIGDGTKPEFVSEITKKYGTFDIILDDGSHINRHVIQSFEMLFPLLNDNGLYIIEDTICFKSPRHLDRSYPDHLSYFSKYLPFLNQWRYDSMQGIKDQCVDPFKIQKKTSNVFEQSIDKIDFGCSYIAVHKKIRQNWV